MPAVARLGSRGLASALVIGLLSAGAGRAQSTVSTFDGDALNDGRGFTVRSAGDVNADGVRDTRDAISLIRQLQLVDSQPVGPLLAESGDVNGDGRLDVSDALYLLEWLYAGGPPPRESGAGGLIDDAARPRLSSEELRELARTGAAVPDHYVVVFRPDVADPRALARRMEADHGLAVRHVYSTKVKGFCGFIPRGRLAAVRADPRVLDVEAERVQSADAQTLPKGIDRIEADRNPVAAIDGVEGPLIDLDVAIIDGGIDGDHPDLVVAGGVNFAKGPSSRWDDKDGHGTHVAGTVGAIDNDVGVVGVAPGVRVWAVRVCDGGWCLNGDMVAGIDWVAQQKASGAVDFAAANMSISTDDDPEPCDGNADIIHEAICGLVNEGVVFTMSAGNESREKLAYPEAIAVAALLDCDGFAGGAPSYCNNEGNDILASFSNYGPEVDIVAPGTFIYSTTIDGGYATKQGTSMAAPHVTGAVALYLYANGLAPASDRTGADAIRAAILAAAIPEGTENHICSYDDQHGGSTPLLVVNGAAFGGSRVCSARTSETDLSVNVFAPVSVALGDVASVEVRVFNNGGRNVPEDIDVTLIDETDGATIGVQTITGGLAPGDLPATLAFSWNTAGASLGDHTLTASHDIVDDDPANDSRSTIATVVDLQSTDIAVTSVAAATFVTQGDVVSVDVSIENVGTVDVASDIPVTLTDTTDAVSIGSQTIAGGLAAGASTTLAFSWDTSGATSGWWHTLVATHGVADDVAANDSKSTSVRVNAPSTGSHVGDLDGSSGSQGGTWTATVTITLHDGSHAPVSGATISGTWSGGVSGAASGTTDSNGLCTFAKSGIPKKGGAAVFTVTSVTHATLTYDSVANHDPDGDSDGTAISISKP